MQKKFNSNKTQSIYSYELAKNDICVPTLDNPNFFLSKKGLKTYKLEKKISFEKETTSININLSA